MSRKRKTLPSVPVVPSHWSNKEYAIARSHAKRKLDALAVPRNLWPDLLDECLALAWSDFAEDDRRERSIEKYKQWVQSKIDANPSQADKLRGLDPRLGVIRSLVSYRLRCALGGARLADTRPHRQYRDAMKPGNPPKRIGIEDGPTDCQDKRMAYLEEIVFQAIDLEEPDATMVPIQDIMPILNNDDRWLFAKMAKGYDPIHVARELNIPRKQAAIMMRALRKRITDFADRREDEYRSPSREPLPIPSLAIDYRNTMCNRHVTDFPFILPPERETPKQGISGETIRERFPVQPVARTVRADTRNVRPRLIDCDGEEYADTISREVTRNARAVDYVRSPDAWWNDPRCYMLCLFE